VLAFVTEHRPLILKHARAFVRANAEKIAGEDVAREVELVLAQLAEQRGTKAEQIESPDSYLRAIVLHAARRAKRRHTLIQQIAAGDDLGAVTDDLKALDSDLPDPPAPPSADAKAARALLDKVKGELTPKDRLFFALLFEDDGTVDDVARALGTQLDAVGSSRDRALKVAAALAIEGEGDRRGTGTSPEERREKKLRQLGRAATTPNKTGDHVGDPLLALVHGGDQSDDLADALSHLAACPDCRARLTEGIVAHRSVVVMAIEAPRASQEQLVRVADEAKARLFERGAGRWTAVVAAERSSAMVQKLESEESGIASRVGVAQPVEVPGVPSVRGGAASIVDPGEAGTEAAEVQAWAQAAKAPKRKVATASLGWTAFAVVAVAGAMGIAYLLATR
jgi:DNA-directed RNA polymerase specialized sigma24 family protein